MVYRDNSSIQQLTNTLDLFSGTYSFNLADQKLELVAGLMDRNGHLVKIPPEMGSVSLFQTDYNTFNYALQR